MWAAIGGDEGPNAIRVIARLRRRGPVNPTRGHGAITLAAIHGAGLGVKAISSGAGAIAGTARSRGQA